MFPRLLFLPNFLYFRKSVVKKLRVYCSIDSFNGYSFRPPPDSSTVIFLSFIAKFAIKDRRVRVSFLSFLLRTCSMQHVLGA